MYTTKLKIHVPVVPLVETQLIKCKHVGQLTSYSVVSYNSREWKYHHSESTTTQLCYITHPSGKYYHSVMLFNSREWKYHHSVALYNSPKWKVLPLSYVV